MKMLDLELGSSKRWGRYGPGPWERIAVTDSEAEGLLAEARRWDEAVRERRELGDPPAETADEAGRKRWEQWERRAQKAAEGIPSRMVKVSSVDDAGPDPAQAQPPIGALIGALTAAADKLTAALAGGRRA